MSSERPRVLIVDDEANMRRVLVALLRRDGFDPIEAGDGERALEVLANESVSAVLSDLKMPHLNGLELLEAVRRRLPGLPVILLTAHGTIGSAVEALKQGAFDYLTKPFDPDEIKQVVAKAVQTHALGQREARVHPDLGPEALLVGSSPALERIRRMIERVAPTPATVLITGESGTGKELVARSVHVQSDRAARAFVKINCAAIPEGLLESELFGHERGAFTGASRQKPGRFELADGGTLFLDEIGEMPLAAQPKLLRALQEGRFYRVGGTQTMQVDVRLIAATNRDLASEVAKGCFRQDLYYRLNVVPICIPPLRQRVEDLRLLALEFVGRFAERHGRALEGIEPQALQALETREWPGNIRELENAIERAVLMSDGPRLGLGDFELEGAEATPPSGRNLKQRIRSQTRRLERQAILDALAATNGNVTQAARELGLSRRGLQLKMRELEIRTGT